VNLSAGIEDRATGEMIRVANASMAIRLTRLLNCEAERKPLPEMGPQHVPVRFQLAHDPAVPTAGASVLYVHSEKIRLVAYATSDETARRVARLLAHVDYPMKEYASFVGLSWPPKAYDFGDRISDLPESSFGPPTTRTPTPHRTRIAGIVLWSWLPLVSLAVLAAFVVPWPLVTLVVVVAIAGAVMLPRLLRQ
jgi:hypothetical protein